MNKPTPGPWKFQFDPYEDGMPYCILRAGDGSYSDEGKYGFYLTVICSEADGRLIAAAPDLRSAGILALEAIDNILSSHESQHEYAQLKAAFNALEAALNKAEGRS